MTLHTRFTRMPKHKAWPSLVYTVPQKSSEHPQEGLRPLLQSQRHMELTNGEMTHRHPGHRAALRLLFITQQAGGAETTPPSEESIQSTQSWLLKFIKNQRIENLYIKICQF